MNSKRDFYFAKSSWMIKMKTNFLFYFITFAYSCNAQEKTNTDVRSSKIESVSIANAYKTKYDSAMQIDDYVVEVFEDSKGNIWFGRDGYGASKFDGKHFTHYTKKDGLCSNNVTSIIEDNEGNFWFGSLSSDAPEYLNEGGLSRYDARLNDKVGQTKTFTTFKDVKGLNQNDIYTIYKDKAGNIWIGAVGVGAYRYRNGNFTLFKETNRNDRVNNFGVQSIYEDRNKNLWFGFSGGLFRFDGTTFINITQEGPW